MGQCSHNAGSFISMILFVSNSFDPGGPGPDISLINMSLCTSCAQAPGAGRGHWDEHKSRLPGYCGHEEYLDYNMCIMRHILWHSAPLLHGMGCHSIMTCHLANYQIMDWI